MKASVFFSTKWAYVAGITVSTAGWFGFHFAKGYQDLVDDGWRLDFFSEEEQIAFSGNPVTISGPSDVADLIRNGPKKCCHKCCH